MKSADPITGSPRGFFLLSNHERVYEQEEEENSLQYTTIKE